MADTADQLHDLRCANDVLHRALTARDQEIARHLATIERLTHENEALKMLRPGTHNVHQCGMGWK